MVPRNKPIRPTQPLVGHFSRIIGECTQALPKLSAARLMISDAVPVSEEKSWVTGMYVVRNTLHTYLVQQLERASPFPATTADLDK